MRDGTYELRAKSGGWNAHPSASDPAFRLLQFSLAVTRSGKPLGGNNIQAVVGAPDKRRTGLDEDVALWLPSGWWISLRNQFAQAPGAATSILEAARDELSAITAELMDARGPEAEELSQRLFGMTISAVGPDHWR